MKKQFITGFKFQNIIRTEWKKYQNNLGWIMKSIIFIILVYTSDLFPQDPHQYFPHHVGDTWQWRNNEGGLITIKFEGDSVDLEGNTFINSGPVPYPILYWRLKINSTGDSIYYLPHGLNWLQYRFPIDSGDVWLLTPDSSVIAFVEDKSLRHIFGKITTVVTIGYYGGGVEWKWTEEYAYGIGRIWYGNEVEYRVLIGCVIDGDTLGNIISYVDDIKPQHPDNFILYQNYPNPFNPSTTIVYEISEYGLVILSVFNALGEVVSVLENEYKIPGRYSVKFNGSGMPSGVYFYKLNNGGKPLIKKMLLLR